MYKDTRISLLACGCKQIELGGTIYQLDASVAVSRGGSCLVYHAIRKDPEKASRDRRVILKEFYPYHKDSGQWRKEDGCLEFPEDLAGKKEQFENSYDRFTELCNTGMDNHTVKPEIFARTGNSVYMVVEYSSGITLDAYMRECSLFDFFVVMENLAGVLGALHGKGYLHMDVKPSNILCVPTNPEHPAQKELTRLLDTDSFIRKKDFSEEIAKNGLSGSPGYTAPEVIELGEDPDDFLLKEDFRENGECADIYSFGAVIYEYIFNGELPGAPYVPERSPADLKEALRKKYEDIPLKAVSLITKLLKFTLEKDPYERFESMAAIGEAISRILPLINPREVRVQENVVLNREPLIGRQRQLAQLRALLCQPCRGTRIVCITGVGGIGKSSLARGYAKHYGDEYDVIVEVSADSAAKAISEIRIHHWVPDAEAPEEKIEERKKKLADLSRKYRTLILVNDYDVFSDPHFKMWRELGNCSVILTSRYDQSGNNIPAIALHSKDLTAEQAREIFLSYYLQEAKSPQLRAKLTRMVNEEKQALDTLIAALNYHPLGIKLTARYLAAVPGEEQGPRQGIQQLEKELFSAASAVNVPDNKDNIAPLQANVYGHLEVLFRKSLKNGHLSENAQDALRYMTLIPSAYGISTARFRKWTGVAPVYLKELSQYGWLEYIPGRKDPLEKEEHWGVYTMPLVIQEFLQKGVFSPYKTEAYSLYLETLIRKMQERGSKDLLWEHSEKCVQAFAGERTKEYLYLLMETGTAFRNLPVRRDEAYEKKKAQYWEQSLSLCEDYPEEPLLRFQCYCRMAGRFPNEEDLPYLEKAREALFAAPRNTWDMAQVYSYIEKCHHVYGQWMMRGRYDDALTPLLGLFLDFRDIKGRWQHEVLRDVARCYEETGSEITAALYRRAAMNLCFSYEDESPRYPLGTYSSLLYDQSRFYLDRGRIDKALSYCHRAIQAMLQLDEKYGKGVIWESEYAYLGDLYARKGDYISAAHYHNKAMKEGHYDMVGWELDRAVLAMKISLDYEKWDDAQKGVTSWWEHARDLYQKHFPEMEIQSKEDFLWAMECAASEIFERKHTNEVKELENKHRALAILKDRVELFRRIHGQTQGLAREYRRLAAVYRQCEEEAKCRKYLRMARRI